MYVIGGTDSSKCVLSAVKRYDSETNLWQDISPLNNARSSICVVADENYIYAIGGYINSTPGKCLDIVERFDPKFNSWNRIAPTQAKRRNAAGISLESKILFLEVLICLVDVLVKFMTKRQMFGLRLKVTLPQSILQVLFVFKVRSLRSADLARIKIYSKSRH